MAEKTWYYGVVYLTNGEACISAPFETKEKCIDEMKKAVMRHPEKVKATSFITRKGETLIPLQKIFGCPSSRNLMSDKKFLREIIK